MTHESSKPESKMNKILTIIQRIIGFPFFMMLALIGATSMFLKWCFNYMKYGGEAIAYTDKMSRKTIQDVFVKLTEKEEVK